MGLSGVLARLAVRATQVLVVEVPGHGRTRMEVEHQLLRRGWRPAWTPADADVLAVCGAPGPDLSELVGRLWEQMPGPRVRIDLTSPHAVGAALDDAATRLLDTPQHRRDARERAQEPQISEDMDHGEMDHGEMDMAPEGIPLAEGGEDRDGLEMDVIHLPLGPVLPFWPAGLVLSCSLQGDVVVEAEASVIDPEDLGAGTDGPRSAPVPAAVVRCDQVMGLLALTGAEDAAASARRTRDALLRGDQDAARDAAERMRRTIRRTPLLRWSLRGVLPLDPSDLERHGLPRSCRGDAHDRLLLGVERIRAEAGGTEPVPADEDDEGAVPWEVLPALVTGLELASVRLAVASLEIDRHPAAREVGHV